jgi:nucleoside 2-deoxyribosyltransferase
MAQHIFLFDKHYLDQSDVGVLLAPAGKSAYLELGYLTGQGKPTFIVQEKDPERWDVMAAFATVCDSVAKVAQKLELIKA